MAVGLLVGYLAAPGAPPNPQERGLDANLWMQTAGEYRACCLQTYRLAGERLEKKVKETPPTKGKPFAVVMDLDETVLANTGYQTWLYKYGQDFSDKSWEEWEKNHFDEVQLVPGARAFIGKAEKAGVTVVYLSNRSEKNRAGTIAALEHVGLSTRNIEKRLLLLTKKTGSDKTSRPEAGSGELPGADAVRRQSAHDFDERFKANKVGEYDVAGQNKGIAERLKLVDELHFPVFPDKVRRLGIAEQAEAVGGAAIALG